MISNRGEYEIPHHLNASILTGFNIQISSKLSKQDVDSKSQST